MKAFAVFMSNEQQPLCPVGEGLVIHRRQERERPKHRCQWGPQFMADRGHKLASQLAQPPLFGHINDLGYKVVRIALGIAHHTDAQQSPHDRSIGPDIAFLDLVGRDTACLQQDKLGQITTQIVRMRQRLKIRFQQILFRIS